MPAEATSVERPLTASGLGSVAWRGGWAITDHALVAASQLLLHLVLARLLPSPSYGAFAIAYGVVAAGAALHAAFLAEPPLVLARRAFAGARGAYLGALVLLHGAATLGLALIVAATVVLALPDPDSQIGWTVLAAAASLPALLLLTLLRRFAYAWGDPRRAAQGSAVHAVALVAGLVLVLQRDLLSPAVAFACLAAASLLASVSLLAAMRTRVRRPDLAFVKEVLAGHLAYGRWAALAALILWIPWNAHYWILAGIRPLEEIAAIRAAQNVSLPIAHLLAALSTLALPVLAAQISSRSEDTARATAQRWGLLLAAAAGAYFLVVLVLGERALDLVYGGAYPEAVALAPAVAAIHLPLAGIMWMTLLHRSVARTDRAFRTWLPYGLLSFLVGGLGWTIGGPHGLVTGIFLAALVALALGAASFRAQSPWGARR